MRKVTLTIIECKHCPDVKIGISYSLDGFDRGCDWTCNHPTGSRTLATFVEKPSEEPKIPEWCPRLTTQEINRLAGLKVQQYNCHTKKHRSSCADEFHMLASKIEKIEKQIEDTHSSWEGLYGKTRMLQMSEKAHKIALKILNKKS